MLLLGSNLYQTIVEDCAKKDPSYNGTWYCSTIKVREIITLFVDNQIHNFYFDCRCVSHISIRIGSVLLQGMSCGSTCGSINNIFLISDYTNIAEVVRTRKNVYQGLDIILVSRYMYVIILRPGDVVVRTVVV